MKTITEWIEAKIKQLHVDYKIKMLLEQEQIGWYNPDSKRFCYSDEGELSDRQRGYTMPVFVRRTVDSPAGSAAANIHCLAERIADRLITNGNEDITERLVFELPGDHNGGGWCRASLVREIRQELHAVNGTSSDD